MRIQHFGCSILRGCGLHHAEVRLHVLQAVCQPIFWKFSFRLDAYLYDFDDMHCFQNLQQAIGFAIR